MKLSYKWLSEYLDLPENPNEVAALITQHVAEVEHVTNQADHLNLVVVGKIIAIRPHPNANKLQLCDVEIGQITHQIVCGGSNIKVDQLVAVALPGARVYWHGAAEPTVLAETTIRGESSYGMICASVELGLTDLFPATGEREIIDLSQVNNDNLKSGMPLADSIGYNDTIIEIDNKTLTHRPDLFCHLGFARELAVILKQSLRQPALLQVAADPQLDFSVTIVDPSHCRRYVGVVLDEVKVGSSPAWLQQRLQSIGLRPINNVVDITNYVMMEYGQPLHAFDYDRLVGKQLQVRLAKAGESITTLDGKTHTLNETILVIADAEKPQAIAGVMGGADSEINYDTSRIVIESANFNPTTIRLGAQQLAIRTDGSTRHEKNLPLAFPELGMWRAIALLQECAQAKVASTIIDERTVAVERLTIQLSTSYVQRLMGVPITTDAMVDTLTRLGCTVTSSDETLTVTPPVYRTDLTIAEELIEEIARIYGYNAIAPQPLIATLNPQLVEPAWKLAQQSILRAAQIGAFEVLNYSFYSTTTAERFGLKLSDHTRMLNPMNPDQALLRIQLRPNLLLCAEQNLERGLRDFILIEYGHTYTVTEERNVLGLVCVGATPEVFRKAKAVAEWLNITAPIQLDTLGKWFAASVETNILEIAQTVPTIKEIPVVPGIELDISVSFPIAIPWSDIERVIMQAGQPLIDQATVFDTYSGSGVKTGYRALGIRMILQTDRTLTMDEAEQLRHTVITSLQTQFQAEHRY